MMMRSFCGVVFAAALLASASAVSAQTPVASAATPVASPWSVAGEVGAASVQNVGAAAGARLDRQVNDRVSAFVRTTWMADTVSRRRLAMASSLAAFTSTARGISMTSDVAAPAVYAGVGASLRLKQGPGWYPTVFAEAGMARVTFQPTFAVSGTDVTGTIANYGITLGEDLTGEVTKAAFGAGVGLVVPKGKWGVGAQARYLQIQTPAEATKVLSLMATIGYRF